jgi:nucleotide-binding universal stress UspA family protein
MESQIVVGVSRYDQAELLEWAVNEALRWSSALLLVHCCGERLETEMPYPDDDLVAAREILEHFAEAVRDRGVESETRLSEGVPGKVLVECSKTARLLVVGPTHRSRIPIPLHASVSTYCVRHALCPVAIVPSG